MGKRDRRTKAAVPPPAPLAATGPAADYLTELVRAGQERNPEFARSYRAAIARRAALRRARRPHTTLDGVVLDLHGTSDDEALWVARATAAVRRGVRWTYFMNRYVLGAENPVLRVTRGVVTHAVWNHPAFQAVYDLGDRLGIAQGDIASTDRWDGDRSVPGDGMPLPTPPGGRW